MEKFLIPVHYKGKIYTEGDLIKPRGGVLADAEKSDNDMIGIVKLVSGCLASIVDTNGEMTSNKNEIESIVRQMPYQTAEYLAMKVFVNRSDGKVEQIVPCPRCKEKYIYEFINDEIDNRISFNDLEVNIYDNLEDIVIDITLDDPIEIKDGRTKEVIQCVESMSFRMPTMNDGISASMKYGNDPSRRQYQMYISAMATINGNDVDVAYKNTWGMWLFDRMGWDDIKKISDQIRRYGMIKSKTRTCEDCGKTFDFIVDTSNFFG